MRVVLALIGLLALGEQAMADVVGITSNVLQRVRRIVAAGAQGTVFSLDVDGRQYLVTAKHVVGGIQGDKGQVDICIDQGKCETIDVQILRAVDPVDIAVLVPPRQMTAAHPLPAEGKGIVLGQDVYFVGFPYADPALNTSTGDESIGFVRKAIWSAQERKDGWVRLYLDGRNNSGFSGSPVAWLQQGGKQFEFKIAAVVSGYRPDYTEVMHLAQIDRAAITPADRAANSILEMQDGTFRKLMPTGNVVAGNTGIVIAYGIEAAIDLIRASTVLGPEIKP